MAYMQKCFVIEFSVLELSRRIAMRITKIVLDRRREWSEKLKFLKFAIEVHVLNEFEGFSSKGGVDGR